MVVSTNQIVSKFNVTNVEIVEFNLPPLTTRIAYAMLYQYTFHIHIYLCKL